MIHKRRTIFVSSLSDLSSSRVVERKKKRRENEERNDEDKRRKTNSVKVGPLRYDEREKVREKERDEKER